jgi:hypothetical protein
MIPGSVALPDRVIKAGLSCDLSDSFAFLDAAELGVCSVPGPPEVIVVAVRSRTPLARETRADEVRAAMRTAALSPGLVDALRSRPPLWTLVQSRSPKLTRHDTYFADQLRRRGRGTSQLIGTALLNVAGPTFTDLFGVLSGAGGLR